MRGGARVRSAPPVQGTQGIICSQGSRFGGYALSVKSGKLVFVYNFLGIPPEQRLTTEAPKLGKHVLGVEFNKEPVSKNRERHALRRRQGDCQ